MNTPPPNNLEAFDYAVALVFSKLFECFPERMPLDGMRLVIEAALDKDISEETRETIPQILNDTIRWLCDEGFIRYDNQAPPGEFRDVTLTLRGLTILGYVPVSLKESPTREPLINKIRAGLRAGGKTVTHEIIKQAVGLGFKLFLADPRPPGTSDV